MSARNSFSYLREVSVLALLLLLTVCARAPFALAATAPAGFQVNTVVSGLATPTSFAFAPDGRIFIAQKSGAVRLVKNNVLQQTPVLQLNDLNDYGDRGLEGITLDPNFAQNGYLYLAYTFENTPGQNYQGPKTGRIVRVTVSGDTADMSTKKILVGSIGGDATKPSCKNFAVTADCIPSDSNAHSMGGLHFGPDGKLYAAIGDGSGYLNVDPQALNAQNVQSLGGKMLRLNTDGTAPSDNPFYDGNINDNQSKVWTLGHRNSFRFNFAPDGTLFIGEVGWATWEEVDVGAKGANYGWPCREGFVATSYNCTPSSAATDPVYVYDHSSGSGSVVGGVVLGAKYPAPYAGSYLFGDYSNSYIKYATLGANHTLSSVNDFISGADGPVDFELSPDGTLYYLALNKGELRNVVYSSSNRPPVAAISANPTQGPAPLLVHFSAANSTDPDSDPMTFAWNWGDGQTGGGTTVDHTFTANGSYTTSLTATDSHGGATTAQTTISVSSSNTQTDPTPRHVSTTITPAPTHIGDQTTITSSVRNDGAASPFIVDIEVYNSSGQLVGQQVLENQTINTGATKQFSLAWQPPAIGDYVVKVGLFKSGWAGLYEWTDHSLGFTVLARTPTSGGAPVFNQSTAFSTPPAVVGTQGTITATVQNTGGAGDALVDLEVYQSGAKVGQQFFDNQHFDANQSRPFTYQFTPPSAGDYTVSVGIFTPTWASLYNWFDSATSFTASGSTPPSSSGAPIYQDALAAGWENWSWNSTVDFADVVATEGSKSIKVTYTSPWAGLYLHGGSGISAGKSTLTFAVMGVGSGQQLQVYLFDTGGHALTPKNLSGYISGGVQNGVWSQVSIPLSDLGASNVAIGGMVVQDVSGSSGATIRLDNIVVR